MVVGERLHPTVTLLGASVLVAVGMTMFASGSGGAALAIVLYGAGNGVWSIARGTVPLALFGPDRYPVVMGRLAAPNLIVQAAAPFAAGMAITSLGTTATLATLAAVAATNVVLAVALIRAKGLKARTGAGQPSGRIGAGFGVSLDRRGAPCARAAAGP